MLRNGKEYCQYFPDHDEWSRAKEDILLTSLVIAKQKLADVRRVDTRSRSSYKSLYSPALHPHQQVLACDWWMNVALCSTLVWVSSR